MSHIRCLADDYVSPTRWPRPCGVALGWHPICLGATLDSFFQKGPALGSHEPQNGPESQARLGLIAGPRLGEVSCSMTEFVPRRSSLLGPLLATVLWKGLLGQRCHTHSAGRNSGFAWATCPGLLGPTGGWKSAMYLRSSLWGGEWSWSPSLPGDSWRRVCELDSLSQDTTVMDVCFLAKPTEVGPRISKHLAAKGKAGGWRGGGKARRGRWVGRGDL